MKFSIKNNISGGSTAYIEGSQVKILEKNIVFLCLRLKIDFVLVNSSYYDQIPRCASEKPFWHYRLSSTSFISEFQFLIEV